MVHSDCTSLFPHSLRPGPGPCVPCLISFCASVVATLLFITQTAARVMGQNGVCSGCAPFLLRLPIVWAPAVPSGEDFSCVLSLTKTGVESATSPKSCGNNNLWPWLLSPRVGQPSLSCAPGKQVQALLHVRPLFVLV